VKRPPIWAWLAPLALVPATLAAQGAPNGSPISLVFQDLQGGDSAYVAQAGGTLDLLVNAYDQFGRGLTAFTFRLWYDPALLTFVSARSSCPDSVASPLSTPVTGANYVELSATGCQTFNAFQHNVATVRFQLAAGATAGTGIYLEPRALTDRAAVDRSPDGDGDFGEVCLGVGIWGDVDGDGVVNSRDALIALSNAVGLPTPGFFIARGDVDGDGYTGSRDALGMLSASIGYPPAFGFRTGRGIPTACAPQPVFARALYYIREGPLPGRAGISGLVVRAAGDSASVIVGDSADTSPNVDYRPRVSPNGAQVVFACYWDFYFNICRANADGSGLVSLTAGAFATDMSPDWSPASDSVVFVRNNQIWVMAADGANAHQIPSSPSVYSVAWAPTAGSRRIAYVTTAFPGEVRLRSLDSALVDSLVFAATTYARDIRSVDWSPGADSLAFAVRVNNYYATYLAPRGGGPAVRVAKVQGPGFAPDTRPTWTDQGVFITGIGLYPFRNRLYLLRPNGTMVRIARDATGNFGPGMDKQ